MVTSSPDVVVPDSEKIEIPDIDDAEPKPRSLRQKAAYAVSFLLKQWFLIGVGLAILLAHFFSSAGASNGPHHKISEPFIHWLSIALIFFISGLGLSTSALKRQSLNFRLHIATLVISFLIFPALMFGIVSAARAGQGLSGTLDPFMMAGFVFMGVAPTTVASNVTMTRLAGGNTEGATIEVVISNVLGVFITPLLLTMFLRDETGWGFATPQPANGGGITDIYKQMAKQLSLILIVPLIVGQVLQNLLPKAVKKARDVLYLDRVGQFLLLINIWAAFCNAFYSGAFEALSPQSIAFMVLLDFGIYILLVAITFSIARLPGLGAHGKSRAIEGMRFSKEDTVALVFCAISKGIVLGTPLLTIFYSGYNVRTQGLLIIPIVVYQGMQIVFSQLLVYVFTTWLRRSAKVADVV